MQRDVPAPVRDINTYKIGKHSFYRVQKGDTLYSIAWQNEKDYRELAALNHLEAPYTLHVGDKIRLTGGRVAKPATKQPPKKHMPPKRPSVRHKKPTLAPVHHWHWPVNGKITRAFSSENKGIEIVGTRSTPVTAANGGTVVYAGNGIRGYDYLVIIKHNASYLSAYGYNRSLLVREGQWVKKGQPIARMGNTHAGRYLLHFEIRKNGKPVDPIWYLKKR